MTTWKICVPAFYKFSKRHEKVLDQDSYEIYSLYILLCVIYIIYWVWLILTDIVIISWYYHIYCKYNLEGLRFLLYCSPPIRRIPMSVGYTYNVSKLAMQKSLWVLDAAASDVTDPSSYPVQFHCPVQPKESQSQPESHTHTQTHTGAGHPQPRPHTFG